MKKWTGLNFSSKNSGKQERKIQGIISKISDGVITIRGLAEATAGEMIRINVENTKKNVKSLKNLVSSQQEFVYAMVLNLGTLVVEAIIFGDESKVKEGATAELCRFPVQLSVSLGMLGRVIDPLGNFLDGKGSSFNWSKISKKVDIKAPGIIERESVHESMETGLKAVDSMVPIGRGQRELIIGDRQTGKTAVAVDAILNQGNIQKNFKGLTILPADLQNDSTEKFQFRFLRNNLRLKNIYYDRELNSIL